MKRQDKMLALIRDNPGITAKEPFGQYKQTKEGA